MQGALVKKNILQSVPLIPGIKITVTSNTKIIISLSPLRKAILTEFAPTSALLQFSILFLIIITT